LIRCFDQPYFLAPEKGGEKAYALLRDVLHETKKVGIAKVVLRKGEHLAAVKPLGPALVLELMHFAEELADPKELAIPEKVEVGKKEMAMASTLVEGMTDKWKPEKYHNQYREALVNVIDKKIAAGGKEAPAQKLSQSTKATKVIDLVSVLQKSLNQTQAAKRGSTRAAAKRRKAA